MVVSKYHKKVQEYIKRFGEENPQKYIKVHKGNECPIPLLRPRSRRLVGIPYEPDVWFLHKSGKKYIFEIFDSEMEKIKEVIADIVRSLLSRNTSKVFFIIPTFDEGVIIRLYEMWGSFYHILIYSGFGEKLLPPEDKLYIYSLLKSEIRSYRKVKRILKTLSKQDNW